MELLEAKREYWVVIRATAPHWLTLQIPRVIARMMGLRSDLLREGRRLAFMNWGPGVTQVVPLMEGGAERRDASPHDPTLAIATFTVDLLFTLPSAVQNHLGLRIARRGRERVKGTDDIVAWMVPENEWREDEAPERGPLPRVYLTRSRFPAPLRS